MKTFLRDQLQVMIYDHRAEMGKAAAEDGAEAIREVIRRKGYANVMFAAAPSQLELLDGLVHSDVDWRKVNAFHMDNYLGLEEQAPQQFSNFLTRYLFGLVPFGKVYLMGSREEDVDRYAEILRGNPLDICFMGIGENGHLAFNDPPVADFRDPCLVKKVRLDEICRKQQVHDKCFDTLEEVPQYAITATIPALMSAERIFCVVPAASKANAVRHALCDEISTACPAGILRTHPAARLYLDRDSAEGLQ